MWLITLTTILIVFYLILVRIFRTGWKGTETFHPKKTSTEAEYKVSVVISCRNEEKNLPKLLRHLENQTYRDFELVLVNDHSTDETGEIMREAEKHFPRLIYIEATGNGKKKAISEGIIAATGDLIITTDADCEPVPTWIDTIVQFQTENPSHLIICPIKLKDKKTFFSRLQLFEFTTLVASGAGAAGASYPIMCNAANMAFTKDAWLASQKDLKPEEQSGDDIFLLQSIKKKGGIIRFLRSKKAFSVTEPARNLKEFIRQRRRWAGKSTSYTDFHLIITACIVFGICLAQLMLLVGGIFNSLYLYFFLFFFIIKYWIDTKFLNDVGDFFSLPSVAFYSLCLSVVYPFYIVFTAVSATFFKPKKWK